MTTKILLAPSAAGKTHFCIERIQEVLLEKIFGPIRVVVPDRLQAYAFRKRLSAQGGAIGVYVGTFGDLHREILRLANRPIALASEPMIQRLLRSALRDIQTLDGLEHYGPIAQMPGFLQGLGETFSELKLARLWPETFLSEADSEGLLEIANVYQSYQERLGTLGWADSQGVNWLATEALEAEPTLAVEWSLLIIDGFDSFNAAQKTALRLLGERLEETLVTLPGLSPTDRVANRRFARSLEQLLAEVPADVVALDKSPRLPEALAHIERTLFEAQSERHESGKGLTMLAVRSPREEAHEALRWLKARIVRDNLSAYDCAIVTPDPERYRAYLREAGAEFGLPLRFTHGEPLASAPGIAALLDLLELPQKNFPRRLFLEAVRTPYFDLDSFGFAPEDADQLELVAQHGLVIQGMLQWHEAFTILEQWKPTPDDDYDELLPRGARASELWQSLQGLAQRLDFPTQRSLKAWVRWLEDLLDELRFLDLSETKRDEAAFLELRKILRALALAETVTGTENISGANFCRTLRSFLEGTNFQERHKRTEPAIMVLRVLEVRGLRYPAVAVLGMAEGIFPEVEREDPLLNENIRTRLNLDPRLGREQGGLFYQVVTRADQHLLLTRPYLADDGEQWEPSPFWEAVEKLFQDAPHIVRDDTPRPMAEAASSQEVLFWSVRREGLPRTYSKQLLNRWEFLRHAKDVIHARNQKQPQGMYEGYVEGLIDQLRERYSAQHVWSSSRLETYGSCPHRFFVESALDLEIKEPPELGINALQLGTLLHQILEEAYQTAQAPDEISDVLEAMQTIAQKVFATAPQQQGFRPTALWHIEQELFTEALQETIIGLADLEEGWTPIAFEQAFGMQGERALEIENGDERIRVRGLIDRLDRDQEGQVRVVDYKTGGGHLRPRDLITGQRLQLPIYSMAAQSLELGDPVDGLYWTILSAKAGSLRLNKFEYELEGKAYDGLQGAIELASEHVKRIVRGVSSGEFPPVPPSDGCPAYCAAATWCWRYTPSGW